MRIRRAGLVAFVALLLQALSPPPSYAVEPDEILPDAAMEQRARGISTGLRCLVCQNQSIDDSHAPLARDLRLLVRERLKAGDSDQAVLDFVVDRYGDFVLLKPPMRGSTLLLWLTPIVVLIGGILLARASKARSARDTNASPEQLTAEEARQLDKLLKKDGEAG